MPCRDYEIEPMGRGYEGENYRKRCDELAAQLCSSRQILYNLYCFIKDIDPSRRVWVEKDICENLPPELAKEISSEIDGLKKHRAKDKSHAILELERKISKLKADVEKIESLEGTPTDRLLEKVRDLTAKKDQMEESDALHTTLY